MLHGAIWPPRGWLLLSYNSKKKVEKLKKMKKIIFLFIFYRCKTWFYEVGAPLWHVFFFVSGTVFSLFFNFSIIAPSQSSLVMVKIVFFWKKSKNVKKIKNSFFIFYRCKTWFYEVCAALWHVFFSIFRPSVLFIFDCKKIEFCKTKKNAFPLPHRRHQDLI